MSTGLVCNTTFSLTDRMRIQRETIRQRNYIVIGRLTTVVFEGQRDTRGLSQSRPRYSDARQAGRVPEALSPFSEKQAQLWASVTLDWLHHTKAPVIAVSRDRQDLLLPNGLTPLPDIPDPRWVPAHAQSVCPIHKGGCSQCVAPRIAQKLTGCPVVGDRIHDKITSRRGHAFGVVHPILELCVMLSGSQGGFAKIRGGVNPADSTHMAMLISEDESEGYLVGGQFQFGG